MCCALIPCTGSRWGSGFAELAGDFYQNDASVEPAMASAMQANGVTAVSQMPGANMAPTPTVSACMPAGKVFAVVQPPICFAVRFRVLQGPIRSGVACVVVAPHPPEVPQALSRPPHPCDCAADASMRPAGPRSVPRKPTPRNTRHHNNVARDSLLWVSADAPEVGQHPAMQCGSPVPSHLPCEPMCNRRHARTARTTSTHRTEKISKPLVAVAIALDRIRRGGLQRQHKDGDKQWVTRPVAVGAEPTPRPHVHHLPLSPSGRLQLVTASVRQWDPRDPRARCILDAPPPIRPVLTRMQCCGSHLTTSWREMWACAHS